MSTFRGVALLTRARRSPPALARIEKIAGKRLVLPGSNLPASAAFGGRRVDRATRPAAARMPRPQSVAGLLSGATDIR